MQHPCQMDIRTTSHGDPCDSSQPACGSQDPTFQDQEQPLVEPFHFHGFLAIESLILHAEMSLSSAHSLERNTFLNTKLVHLQGYDNFRDLRQGPSKIKDVLCRAFHIKKEIRVVKTRLFL